MSNWVPPGHGENGTPGETLWNRPDRGLPPIAEIVDGLLVEADARLDAIAARYGINREPAEWPARVDADLIDRMRVYRARREA
jgi:hypothetical protein